MRPFQATAKLLYDGPWVAERHAAIRSFLATNRNDIYPVTRSIIEGAIKFSATDAFEAWYALAARKRETEAVWRSIDAMVVPTAPNAPTVAEVTADPLGPNARLGTWTNFVNLLDLAALAVPGPFRPDGLPAGITLIGPRASDAALASLGRVFHAKADVTVAATGRSLPSLRDLVPDTSGLIEIAVVGAHLSGMPLNNELKAAGAVFRRAVDTEDCYQLYALAGGPPKRPGLLRIPDRKGHAIATEVWALSPDGFGRFVAGIPAPLGIGTLRLADGTKPKGFLVEPEGLTGAQNISHFGGWRAFVAAAA
jgi:allophanate hydrolase